MLSLAAAGT